MHERRTADATAARRGHQGPPTRRDVGVDSVVHQQPSFDEAIELVLDAFATPAARSEVAND